MSAPQERLRLLLWGMSGSGKSSVAPLIAARIGARCLDVDAQIEAAAGRSITAIFAEQGEQAFRALERAALQPLVAAAPAAPEVVALGGGALLDAELRSGALHTCFVVVLQASAEQLARRLASATDRPLLSGPERVERLRALQTIRAQAYAEGHLHIDTEQQTAAEVAAIIAARWTPRP